MTGRVAEARGDHEPVFGSSARRPRFQPPGKDRSSFSVFTWDVFRLEVIHIHEYVCAYIYTHVIYLPMYKEEREREREIARKSFV